MALLLVLIAVAHQGHVLRPAKPLRQTQRKLLAMVFNDAIALVDLSDLPKLLSITATELTPANETFLGAFQQSFARRKVWHPNVIPIEREARNFSYALITAVRNVQQAGATVEHIEPDYLVNLSEIAERCHLSRAAISLFTKGERREGFPRPIAHVTTESPLWDWVHVARWMYHQRRLSLEALVQAKLVRDANRAVLETKGHIEHSRFGKRFLVEPTP